MRGSLHPLTLAARFIGAMLAALIIVGKFASMSSIHATTAAQAQFELAVENPYSLEARCPRQIVLIHWRTGREQNVDVFRVHRRTVNEEPGGEWVNAVPLVALGDNSSYTVVDAQVEAGRSYRYTLYGFVAAEGFEEPVYLLSDALGVELGEVVQPTCLYLPLTST